MAGRFEGLTDIQWATLEPLLPPLPAKRTRGYPKADRRKTLNSLLYILITGCRWCDLPVGEQWGKRSSTHRWHLIWSQDGFYERLQEATLNQAELKGLIDWEASSVDGSFSPRKRRR